MKMRNMWIVSLVFLLGTAVMAQPPQGGGQGMHGGPPPGGRLGGDWIKLLDSNMNQLLEANEFSEAVDRTFAELDKDGSGSIEPGEFPPMRGPGGPGGMGRPGNQDSTGRGEMRPPEGQGMGRMGPPLGGGQGMRQPGQPGQPGGIGGAPPQGERRSDGAERGEGDRGDGKRLLPPFFFGRLFQAGQPVSKAAFAEGTRAVFNELDQNHDGSLSKEEARPKMPGMGEGPQGPPPPKEFEFLAAELRFGDKVVKGQPFSAEIVIEDTRRLYDGTTVTKEARGGIYRDSAGRTRREQSLDLFDRVTAAGVDVKPYKLVFINDFVGRVQYSLDLNNKTARKSQIWNDQFPLPAGRDDRGEKTESLGTKTIEGVSAQGTKHYFEIPAGQLGNEKPIQVVTEEWFSPDLQVMVMSRHIDPLAGEHTFKLVNIKRAEPAAELFAVPSGYKIQTGGEGRGSGLGRGGQAGRRGN